VDPRAAGSRRVDPGRARLSASVAVQSPSDPLRAWRYWQLSPRLLLRSVSRRHVEWMPGAVLHAGCIPGGHPAPEASCNCGISGARDLHTLSNYGLCVAPGALIVGEVDLWGRLVPDIYGWRAEYARPVSVALVDGTTGDDEEEAAALAALGAYGVPVTTIPLDQAVAGVTAATLAFQVMSGRASRGGGGG